MGHVQLLRGAFVVPQQQATILLHRPGSGGIPRLRARLTKKGDASSRPTDITCIAIVPGHDCAMTVAGGESGLPCLGWSLQV